MLAATALAVLVSIGPALVAIPDEPGAEVILDASVVQAAVADLDGDGAREIVVLVAGDGSTLLLEAWAEGSDRWHPMGQAIEVVPADGDPAVTWAGSPIRLVVRRVPGGERVTVARQPAFRGEDPEASCCLLLHDLRVTGGVLRLVEAAPMTRSVDAVWVVDLDGDAVDELVATRSVPPLGDTSYPTEAIVHRWTDEAFAVTESRLEVGSGDTPFPLGDSDGRRGEELGLIATLGRPALYRLALGSDDRLVAEDAGIVADGALGVPAADGRGVAVLAGRTLSVRSWPAGETVGPPLAEVPMGEAAILGTTELNGVESVVVRQTDGGDRVHAFGLPDLAPPRFGAITRSPAAAAFGSGPVEPYVGPIPGGAADGRPAVIYGGRLLASGVASTPEPFTGVRFGTLAGAHPIGLAGTDRSELVLLHASHAPSAIDPRGGRLDPPRIESSATVSVAPFELALEPEDDDGSFDPSITGAITLGGRSSIGIGPAGFTATIEAPPGSRVYVAGLDPSVAERVVSVPASGSVDVPMVPPGPISPSPRYRAALAVTTPSGHSYLATWDVRLLDAPPLDVAVVTPVGSGDVEVSGWSAPYATVAIDGTVVPVDDEGRFLTRRPLPPWPTEIVVTSTDPFGGTTSTTVTGVGWFDYRGLPWIAIVAIGVSAAAIVLAVRVPRPRPAPRLAGDDAALEELEPD